MPKDIRVKIPDDAYEALQASAARKAVTAPQLAAYWLSAAIQKHASGPVTIPPLADREAILSVIREMRDTHDRGDIARELNARGLQPPRAERWTSHLVHAWEKQHLHGYLEGASSAGHQKGTLP